MKYKLTKEESDIEKAVNSLQPVRGNKRKKIESILKHVGKNKSISLRIPSHDLSKLKEKAQSEGIPYQTLIGSILHKYITNQLYEKNEILKSIQILNKR